MKTHQMRLHPEPFERIKSGEKTNELRLNDPKRRQIQIGDRIEFSKRPDFEEKLLAEVVSLTRYPTFTEMYESVKGKCPEHSLEEFTAQMHEFYSPDKEAQFGTLKIEIRIVENN